MDTIPKPSISVLVVDDSRFARNQLREFLETEGHEVCGLASNGFEGQELYMEHRPDLVLLDITMPNQNGRDCLKDLLEKDPNARCIIVSAIQEEAMIVECLQIGAKAYINKPLRLKDEDYCQEFLDSMAEAFEC